MYNRFLLTLLAVSFFFIQNSYSQNLILNQVHSTAQLRHTIITPDGSMNNTQTRMLPVKSDGGYILHQEEGGRIVLSYNRNTTVEDALGIQLTTNTILTGSLSVVDASTDEDGNLVLLAMAQFPVTTSNVDAIVDRNNAPIATLPNIGATAFTSSTQIRGRLQYIVLYIPHTATGFGNPTVFHTISNIDTQEEFDVFTPRFIQAVGVDNIQIAGLVRNTDASATFLGSPIRSPLGVNSRDIVVGHFNREFIGNFSTGNRILALDFRLGTDQAPPVNPPATNGGQDGLNNNLIGFDIDEANSGMPYVYMRHFITTVSPHLQGWIGNVRLTLPPTSPFFTIPLGTATGSIHSFSVYTGTGTNTGIGQLVWGTHSTTVLPVNLITRDINRNYRNYLVVQQGRVSILGNYNGNVDNSNSNITFSDRGSLDISSTKGSNNVMISSWNLEGNDLFSSRWTRIVNSQNGTPSILSNKNILSLDTDLDGNLYFGYAAATSSRILPLEPVAIPITELLGIFVAKMNPCGHVFWNTILNTRDITNIDRISFGFSNSNEIYTLVHPTINPLHRISNTPIQLCRSELEVRNTQTNTLVAANWLENNCLEVATGSSSFTPPLGEGNYSATNPNPNLSNEHFSNAVWLNVIEGANFSLTEVTNICLPDNGQVGYEIVDFLPTTTYRWRITDPSGQASPTPFEVVGVGNNTFVVDYTALGLPSGQYVLEVVAEGINVCTTTVTLDITINNLDFQLTEHTTVCSTDNTVYTIQGVRDNVTYRWRILGQTGFITIATTTGVNIANFSPNFNLPTNTYTLEVEASLGTCNFVRQVQVSNTRVPNFIILGQTQVCNSTFTQRYTIQSRSGAVPQYDWFVDGVLVATNTTFIDFNWQNYVAGATPTISVTARLNGCEITKTLNVEVTNTSPTVAVNASPSFCSNQQDNYPLLLNSVAGVNYTWEILQGGNPVNLPNAIINANINNGVNAQAVLAQLPVGTTEYKVTALFPSGCTATNSVFITITEALNVNLDLPQDICRFGSRIPLQATTDAGTIITSSTHTGTWEYTAPDGIEFENGVYYFNPNVLPDEYTITYTYREGNCIATATDIIRVKEANSYYNVQIFRCATEYNPNQTIEVALLRRLAPGHTLRLTIPNTTVTPIQFVTRDLTSGMYWDINDLGFPVPIGTQIEAEILSSIPNVCGDIYINNEVNSTIITVVEAPAKDIYLKDHPFDFGQQPSGGGYGSPSITITQVAPNFNADFTTTSIDPNTGVSRTIKFYYNNGATGNYNVARNIVDAHNGNIRSGEPNYLYLRVFNRCKSFGKGLRVDALYFPASTAPVPGGLLTEPIPIPQDIEGGGEVIIAIPIENYRVASLGSYHTCSMARIYQARPGIDDLEIFETPGFDLFGRGISESNNMTWRNINIISSTQGEGTIDISNDGLTPKMARIKFDFAENQDPANAHYLENNGFRISLPHGLAQRWQQNNYINNNLSFVNNNPALLEISEPRNAWFEVLLMPGETYRLGLSFDIRPVTSSTPPQESVYHLDITQHNEGELVGGVGYDLMIDFPDLPPVSPSNLSASVVSSSQINLSWVDASDNELVFILERSKAGGAYVHVSNINAGEVTYEDSGLEPYTLYRYRIKAISATGLVSGYTYSPQVRTLDAVPTAPTNLTASLRSLDCKIKLHWEDNASNEYRYEVVRILNGVSTSLSTNIAANTRSYVDNISVSEGATYKYQVRTRSSTGLYSNYAEVELVISTPAAPVNFTVGVVSDGEVQLSWGSVPAMGTYHIEKKVGSTWTSLVSLAGSANSYLDGQVSAGQQYEYRLRGRLGCIFSSYTTQSVTIPALPAPTNFVGVYDVTNNSITLNWTDNAMSESEYILEIIPFGGTATIITLGAGTGSGTTLTYVHANLGNYPSYAYRLYAQTALGVTSLEAETRVDLPVASVTVSGTLKNYLTGDAVGNVRVDLVDAQGGGYVLTDATGYYEFEVAANSPFSIHLSKDINKMNGVDMVDLQYYQKYFLYLLSKGIDAYDVDPYLAIAGDMDADCDVDYTDYSLLYDAVNNTNTFSLPSWQFVSSDYDFATQGYCSYSQERTYSSGISADLTAQDFIGIKMGDVTGSANSLQKVRAGSSEEAVSTALTLDVIPNPFSTTTQLVFGSSVSTSATIHIYNSLGVEVYTRSIEVVEGMNQHVLRLDVSSGLYYISIVGDQINYTSKLVIEK